MLRRAGKNQTIAFVLTGLRCFAGLTKGIEGLFKKNKVTYVKGHGRFADPNTIEVDLLDGSKQTIRTKNTIVASKCARSVLPL